MNPPVQERPPNFRGPDGVLCIVRCFACEPERGRENWALAVAAGYCCWCGWTEPTRAKRGAEGDPSKDLQTAAEEK